MKFKEELSERFVIDTNEDPRMTFVLGFDVAKEIILDILTSKSLDELYKEIDKVGDEEH